MFDSLQEAVTHGPLNKGFVKGLTEQCAQIGFSLADLGLLPVNLKMIMNLSQLQQRAGMDDVDTCPRSCPTEGAMVCAYRWFLREPGQGGRPFFQLPANARKITQLMRFRLGCRGLPNDVGRHRADPLPCHERLCTRCQDGRGDEKHMVFECSALQHIREEYSALFAGHHTMRSLMNQADQRSIIHFISECLDCTQQSHGGRCVAILRWASGDRLLDCLGIYDLTLFRWCMRCTWRFRRSTGFGFVNFFPLGTFVALHSSGRLASVGRP